MDVKMIAIFAIAVYVLIFYISNYYEEKDEEHFQRVNKRLLDEHYWDDKPDWSEF